MSRSTVKFIKASLFYLVLTSTLGAFFSVFPNLRAYKYAHVHLNLLGFMTMMVYGVGNHILPRFQGKPLHSERLAEVQFWAANVGLVALVAFESLKTATGRKAFVTLTATAGLIELLSIYMFVYNMWVTLRKKV